MNCKNNHLSGVPEYVIRLKVNLRIKEHKLFRNKIFWLKYCHRLLLSPCTASVDRVDLPQVHVFFFFFSRRSLGNELDRQRIREVSLSRLKWIFKYNLNIGGEKYVFLPDRTITELNGPFQKKHARTVLPSALLWCCLLYNQDGIVAFFFPFSVQP